MIIHTGMRTDIPAFYSEWFLHRIQEGMVCVRNPYNPSQVTKYSLSPEVVDLIAFCTKNPAPMLSHMDALKPYGQYWFVTITPYGRDIEPNVPDKVIVMEHFKQLSDMVGINSVGWRYDPILVDPVHSVNWHISQFEKMARTLCGYTKTCVISFIDLYKKVQKNFPEARSAAKGRSNDDRKCIHRDCKSLRNGHQTLRGGKRTGKIWSRLFRLHDCKDF